MAFQPLAKANARSLSEEKYRNIFNTNKNLQILVAFCIDRLVALSRDTPPAIGPLLDEFELLPPLLLLLLPFPITVVELVIEIRIMKKKSCTITRQSITCRGSVKNLNGFWHKNILNKSSNTKNAIAK
jgi:hypothetical protein